MSDTVKNRLTYYVLLAVGVFCQVFPRVVRLSWWAGIVAFFWLYAYLELVCRFRKKRELLVTGILFVAGYCLYFSGTLGDSLLSVLLFAVFGLAIFAALCLSARLMLRWNCFPVTLTLPTIWGVEYLLATALRFPSLIRLDMVFTDMTVLIQAERLIGPFGFSFAILWLAALLRFTIANRKAWCLGVMIGVSALLVIPGIVYLYPNMTDAETVRVAYTTGPYVGNFMNFGTVSYAENEKSLTAAVEAAASGNAEILVFNEEAFAMPDTSEERFLARCAELAKENSLYVLLGLDVADSDGSENGKSENKLILFDTDGNIAGSYMKSRLIPFVESEYVPGTGNIPSYRLEMNGKSAKISFLICYDSNFPAYVHRVEADTDILFLPSWDWSEVTELHARLCRAIAVENNVVVLKPTYDGLSIAVNADGQIIRTSTTEETGFEQVQLVDMPIRSTAAVAARPENGSAFKEAIIATEILSLFVCLVLLLGNVIENNERTNRSRWLNVIVVTNMIGCFTDALSWALDGCARLGSVLNFTSAVPILLTFVMAGEFVAYLTEYVKEKKEISNIPVIVSWTYVGIALVLTTAACISGHLYSIDNGIYSDGALYPHYVIANSGAMIISILIVVLYRNELDSHDRTIAYVYMSIPLASAAIGLFIEEWSFVYPAITLSLLVIYVMLQSDRVERLEHEGIIVGYRATHDELTGLYNGRAFRERIEVIKEIKGRTGVIFGDLNGLKYANDNFGHEAGDQLLRRYANILSGIFRMNEIYRISGDEFLCMMENVPEEIFNQRLNALEDRLKQDEPPLASIGAAFGSNQDVEASIKSAEAKMYADKERVHGKYPAMKR